MSTLTQRGNPEPQLQESVLDSDPQRGTIKYAKWRGISQQQMLEKHASLVAAGITSKLILQQGGMAGLDETDNTYNVTVDKWEITPAKENRDAFTHTALLALLNNYQISILRGGLTTAFTDPNGHALDVTPWTDSTGAASAGTMSALINTGGNLFNPAQLLFIASFYNEYLAGGTDYRAFSPVLRHTSNVPNRWAQPVQDWGNGMVYTYGQMLNEFLNDPNISFQLPNSLQYKLNLLSANPPANLLYYQSWGWLKDATSYSTAANNRNDRVTEFTLAAWNINKYPLYTAP